MKHENEATTTAVDPICGMEVDASTALSAEKDGKTFYFCSPGCKQEFLGTEIPAEEPGARSQEPVEKTDDPEPETRNPEPEIHSKGEVCDIPPPGEEAAEASAEACEIPLAGDQAEPATKTVTMGITGMHCASCVANTEKALKKLDGVQSASVNIASESAAVKIDPAKVSAADLEKAITDLGFVPHIRETPGKSVTIGITGMHCASCASTIEKALSKLAGVSEANVNFAAESVMVRFDPAAVSHQDLEKAIADAGYTPFTRAVSYTHLTLPTILLV